MARILGVDYEGDVRVSYVDDGDAIGVHYEQDVQSVVDKIAAENADGGVAAHEGVGRPKYEVPVTIAMEYCAKRGIPWQKFCYTNEYDSEWPKLAAEYSKFRFEHRKLGIVA